MTKLQKKLEELRDQGFTIYDISTTISHNDARYDISYSKILGGFNTTESYETHIFVSREEYERDMQNARKMLGEKEYGCKCDKDKPKKSALMKKIEELNEQNWDIIELDHRFVLDNDSHVYTLDCRRWLSENSYEDKQIELEVSKEDYNIDTNGGTNYPENVIFKYARRHVMHDLKGFVILPSFVNNNMFKILMKQIVRREINSRGWIFMVGEVDTIQFIPAIYDKDLDKKTLNKSSKRLIKKLLKRIEAIKVIDCVENNIQDSK